MKKCFKEIWQLLVSFIFLYIYSITFVKISSGKANMKRVWESHYFDFWISSSGCSSGISIKSGISCCRLPWPISCLFNFIGIFSCVIPSSVMPVPRILERLNSWRLNGRILMYLFFLFLQNSIHRRRKFLIWKNNHE